MKISIKEFSRNPSKFLKELPIIITRGGIPFAEVRTFIPTDDDFEPEVRTEMPESKMNHAPGSTEMCNRHPGSMKITCGCE